jgi:hypothetical protein
LKASKADIDKLKEESDRHQWYACLALERAFAGGHGQRGSLDWTQVAEAAYHAGAAKAIYDCRNIVE